MSFTTRAARQKRKEAYARSLNPTPARPIAEYRRISRALEQIAAAIEDAFRLHGHKVQEGWLPTKHVISIEDDNNQEIKAAIIADGFTEHPKYPGYILSMHKPRLKATNRILVVMSFTNYQGANVLLQKSIYSPIPCNTWTRAPLTLAQWYLCAQEMILQHLFWSWLPALRLETDDSTWRLNKIHGWYMTPCAVVMSRARMKETGTIINDSEENEQRDRDGWIGHNIYKHITEKFSNNDSAESTTSCQQ